MNIPTTSPRVVTYQALLAVYLIIPITLAVILIDVFWLHGTFRRMLPRNPEKLRLYLIFLVFPHIVASTTSFLDREYLRFYQTKLTSGLLAAFSLGVILPWVSPAAVVFSVYMGYTMFHNIAQQVGVAMFMVGKPTTAFKAWKWFTILTGILVYFWIFKIPHWEPLWNSACSRQFCYGLLFITLAMMMAFAVMAGRRSQTRIGVAYLWANCAIVALPAVYSLAGYTCFGILITRMVHDLTGFLFYIAHDSNRNAGHTRNILFQLFQFTGAPVYILSPLLAILVANALVQMRGYQFIASLLIALGYFHYYAEGFMWKRGTLHRLQVPVLDGVVG